MFTESDDFLFLEFDNQDFAINSITLNFEMINPYDNTSINVVGDFLVTLDLMDGLDGFDTIILDGFDVPGTPNFAMFSENIIDSEGDSEIIVRNIEQIGSFGISDMIVNMASNQISHGDLIISSSTSGDTILWGGSGNDTIRGLHSGADHINGGPGGDLIIFALGNDTLIGGEGSDIYQFLGALENSQSGTYHIIETSSEDVNILEIAREGISIDDFQFVVNGANLVITSANHEFIIEDQFGAPNAGIDEIHFFDGFVFNLREIDGNSPPVAIDDIFTIDENSSLSGNLLIDNGSGPDSDINDDLLSVSPETINTANGGVAVIVANGGFTYFAAAGFDGVDSFDYTLLDGNGGSDIGTVTITVNDNLIDGTDEADTLAGGNVQNTIQGFDGDDFIDGGAGDDLLIGNTGQDTLVGGADDDSLFGNFGDDTLNGGSGVDELDGGFGNDLLNGGVEKDLLSGQDGNDILNGEDGNDRLFGGDGLDTLDGGGGADLLFGGLSNDLLDGLAGNDTLRGQEGDDDLFGGSDRDSLFGEDGNDVLDGGDDLDRLFGGIGSDELRGGGGNDNLEGGDGADTLLGQDGLDRMFGQSGSDMLDGGLLRDVLFGGVGDDTLIGGAGNDNLFGGENDDSLVGGLSLDVLQGGSGNDTLVAGEDNDILFGGDGHDLLFGGAGFDRMFGGFGSDTIVLEFDTVFERTDQLLDFEDGDKLDVSDVFDGFGFDGAADNPNELFRIVISGDDSYLQIATLRENLVRADNFHLTFDDMIFDIS